MAELEQRQGQRVHPARAVLTCVDPAQLPAELVGRPYDGDLLADLPEEVDPCGEHGEFHTFVWDGPGFTAPIEIETGEVVERDGFVFCDVLPAS
jgi:diphthamide synthase (EF-2-diphthine--ammonia ligase)